MATQKEHEGLTQKLKTIRLYGKLGAKFGRVHKLAVLSTAEAIRALCIVIPGFEKHLYESGHSYTIFIGRENIGKDQLSNPTGKGDIRIAPIPTGSKRSGLVQVIVGAVLVVAGAYTGNPYLVNVGIGIALGGAIQMLAPMPKGAQDADKPENRASAQFNGPVNTIAQGNCVPVLYGRMIVGSAVISGGIYAEERA